MQTFTSSTRDRSQPASVSQQDSLRTQQTPPAEGAAPIQQRAATAPAPSDSFSMLNVPSYPRSNASGNSGLSDQVRSGIESLSGLSMDDVKVHRNSPMPARVGAASYARGTNIYLGPGREKDEAHEAWHVVQQKRGRVRPTIQAKNLSINTESHLEREADVMGARALSLRAQTPAHGAPAATPLRSSSLAASGGEVIQGFYAKNVSPKPKLNLGAEPGTFAFQEIAYPFIVKDVGTQDQIELFAGQGTLNQEGFGRMGEDAIKAADVMKGSEDPAKLKGLENPKTGFNLLEKSKDGPRGLFIEGDTSVRNSKKRFVLNNSHHRFVLAMLHDLPIGIEEGGNYHSPIPWHTLRWNDPKADTKEEKQFKINSAQANNNRRQAQGANRTLWGMIVGATGNLIANPHKVQESQKVALFAAVRNQIPDIDELTPQEKRRQLKVHRTFLENQIKLAKLNKQT